MLSDQSIKMLKDSLPILLSISDVAIFFKCSNSTIRRQIWNKRLKAFKTNEGWMIYKDDLISYLSKYSNL